MRYYVNGCNTSALAAVLAVVLTCAVDSLVTGKCQLCPGMNSALEETFHEWQTRPVSPLSV